jgi:4-hydroxy-2-oxoheptanedioate aldolase
LENAEEIAAVPGISGLMFGPGDFMIDAGMDIDALLNGRPDPKFLEAMGRFNAAAAKNDLPIFGYVLSFFFLLSCSFPTEILFLANT